MVRLRAIIHGHVQGVGFRYWTHHTVNQMNGIAGGTVRNLPDGTVEVEAEAPDRAPLESLFHALHRGPAAAQVVGVEAAWEETPAAQHHGFHVA